MTSHTSLLTRRTALAAAATGGAVALTGLGAPRAAALTTVRPAPSDALLDRFGMCTHVNHMTTPYGQTDKVLSWLRKLGVRHIRTRLSVQREVVAIYKTLAYDYGIKIQGTCGELGDNQTMTELMSSVRRNYANPAQVFSTFAGINEPNNDGVLWVDETRSKAIALHAARAAYGLTAIPIAAPALAPVAGGGVQGSTTYDQALRLGDLSRYVDYGNMHVYPRGLPPITDIDYFSACARRFSGSKPLICSEGGYFNAMGFHGGPKPTPEAVSAAYAPQQILEHWRKGTRRFFRFELLDAPNPAPADREGTLGMVRPEGPWSAKPCFEPTRQLLAAMRDPGPAFTPRTLDLGITGQPSDFRSVVFGKRNGTHVIAMWLDRMLWHPIERRMMVKSLTAPLDAVTLNLGTSRAITVRHLTTPGTVRSLGASRQESIGLPAGVTLVTIG